MPQSEDKASLQTSASSKESVDSFLQYWEDMSVTGLSWYSTIASVVADDSALLSFSTVVK